MPPFIQFLLAFLAGLASIAIGFWIIRKKVDRRERLGKKYISITFEYLFDLLFPGFIFFCVGILLLLFSTSLYY